MSEKIKVDAFMYVDEAEPVAKAWIHQNYVEALDTLPLDKMTDRVIDNLDALNDDELELLETAIRAEQYRRSKNKHHWLSKL